MIFWLILGTLTHPKDTFVSINQYFNDKSSFFLAEVSFATSEEKHLSYFQNWYFFKILWWCHEPHDQVKYRARHVKLWSYSLIHKNSLGFGKHLSFLINIQSWILVEIPVPNDLVLSFIALHIVIKSPSFRN